MFAGYVSGLPSRQLWPASGSGGCFRAIAVSPNGFGSAHKEPGIPYLLDIPSDSLCKLMPYREDVQNYAEESSDSSFHPPTTTRRPSLRSSHRPGRQYPRRSSPTTVRFTSSPPGSPVQQPTAESAVSPLPKFPQSPLPGSPLPKSPQSPPPGSPAPAPLSWVPPGELENYAEFLRTRSPIMPPRRKRVAPGGMFSTPGVLRFRD